MKTSLINKLAVLRNQYDNTCRRVSVGSGLLAFGGMAMAQTDPNAVDVSDVLLKIAAGLAAALLVSVAFTGAYLGIKASKIARRGG
jgi:hypothetical protein